MEIKTAYSNIILLPLFLLLLCSSGCTDNKPKPISKPKQNVILIVVDTLRADHLGCYGYKKDITPNLDKLAADGILYKRAISTAPWTLPAIGSILSSQYPSALGIYDSPDSLNPKFPLLPKILKKHGYSTNGIISCSMLTKNLGFGKGFDQYHEEVANEHKSITSPMITDKAISFLKKSVDDPFFLFLHYFDPHYAFHKHPEFDFSDQDYNGAVKNGEDIISIWKKRKNLLNSDIEYLISLYDSEIAFTDAYIGKLIDELKRLKLYDNSLIIFTADHGEEFMERGWIGHSIHLYQELIHVPMIIKPPRSETAASVTGECDAYVGTVDITPTVLSHLGLELSNNFEGSPLNLSAPNLEKSRAIFSETFNSQEHRENESIDPVALRCIIKDGFKLVLDQNRNTVMLYNLSDDKYEMNDIIQENKKQGARMSKALIKWLDSIKAKGNQFTRMTENEIFSDEQLKQLKAMGY